MNVKSDEFLIEKKRIKKKEKSFSYKKITEDGINYGKGLDLTGVD